MILDDYTQRIKRRSRSTAQQYGGEHNQYECFNTSSMIHLDPYTADNR